MRGEVHVQSFEFRKKVISTFCRLISLSSISSTAIYLYLKIYFLAGLCFFIGLLYVGFIYLNNKGKIKTARLAIIGTTGFGLLFFSLHIGYDSGIYLYLFVTPLLVYLLFDFSEKVQIIAAFIFYLAVFILSYVYKENSFCIADQIGKTQLGLIYAFNFCSTFILCFGLVNFFASNNADYIVNLKAKQEELVQEVFLRNKSEELLKKSLHEREILLAEIHHRVKNNLAIVSALINMQMDKLKEEESKLVFVETKARIYAMSLIHNLLYQNNSFAKINFAEYVDTFCEHFSETYNTESNISFEKEFDEMDLDMKMAIPMALILNELLTNSYKHAFKGMADGKITIGLKTMNDKSCRFWFSDNGVGMPDCALNQKTMGLDIIKSLTEQIDGQFTYEKCNGSSFIFILPINAN